MFKEYIINLQGFGALQSDSKTSIYPISEDNLEGIRFLIENCMRMGTENNSNVSIATLSPNLWLGDFLDKYWKYISYVTLVPKFELIKVEDNKIISKSFAVRNEEFKSDEEIDKFFSNGRWKKFVIFSMVKYVDLETLSVFYRIRYADITEKYEERDGKINAILQ